MSLKPAIYDFLLDPACGTGTFLYFVLDHIRWGFQRAGKAGMWSSYVREHLLPRIFGFELLMAPYAVAHLKLGMQLAGLDLPEAQREDWAYDFKGDERLGIYLTNTLEEAEQRVSRLALGGYITDEANAAAQVKQDYPVMVVLGNPPYSGHSANKGAWINALLRGKDALSGTQTGNYFEADRKPLGERNPKWLNDDYVKFVRFAQWRIECTGHGILAFITNHGYLDNPTFRGMRQSLMKSFDEIYVLDLHGNSKKKERAPDGGKDENVFDIQQGVAIGLFVRKPGTPGASRQATVRHAHLWGVREAKYRYLADQDVSRTEWATLDPQSPFYFFKPRDVNLDNEYSQGWRLTDMMPVNVLGFQTHRDHFAIDFDESVIRQRFSEMRSTAISDSDFAAKYKLSDNDDWKLSTSRRTIRSDAAWQSHIVQCLYRPFDWRACYFSEVAMDRRRSELVEHVAGRANLCLLSPRQQATLGYKHSWVSRQVANDCVVSTTSREANQVFPLYLYPTPGQLPGMEEPTKAPGGRRPNLVSAFVQDFSSRLGMTWVSDGKGDRLQSFGPEDVFSYTYAVLHSPGYRVRYAEMLKEDFPRVPLTSDTELFRELCALGDRLVGLHLMEQQAETITRYPVKGDNTVSQVRYSAPSEGAEQGRVYINETQYFEGIPPEVWEFHIGGYQVCEKWLKDRKGRVLTYDDLEHYQQIVAALAETIRLMDDIDETIEEHGGWPLDAAGDAPLTP